MTTQVDTTLADVLIVDDHELVRTGMRLLLEDIQRVGEIFDVSSAEAALKLVSTKQIDLILMDINLPGMSGLEAAKRILCAASETRIIIVTGRLEAGPIRSLLSSGVRGYITKGSPADDIDKAVRLVLAGEQYLSPDIAQQFAMDVINKGDETDPFVRLTGREHEIIMRLLRGERNRKMSDELYISEKTVSTHRRRALEKLGVLNSAELVRLAIRLGYWNEE
ncbi:MAG: response regulator transcription factor [Granulosicoccus sp.]